MGIPRLSKSRTGSIFSSPSQAPRRYTAVNRREHSGRRGDTGSLLRYAGGSLHRPVFSRPLSRVGALSGHSLFERRNAGGPRDYAVRQWLHDRVPETA